MFGVVDHLAARLSEIADGVGDHDQVFVEGDAKDFGNVEIGRFADDGDDRRLGIEKRPHSEVFLGPAAAAAGHAERTDADVFQGQLLDPLEKLGVLVVRERIAPFDKIEARVVEPLSDLELVV
jgi:hypothetical protein